MFLPLSDLANGLGGKKQMTSLEPEMIIHIHIRKLRGASAVATSVQTFGAQKSDLFFKSYTLKSTIFTDAG